MGEKLPIWGRSWWPNKDWDIRNPTNKPNQNSKFGRSKGGNQGPKGRPS